MIAEVVPAIVALAEMFANPPDVMTFEAERSPVANAVDERRREFGTIRHCARRALGDLGLPPTALLPGRTASRCGQPTS